MAATNETQNITVWLDGQPCADIQNTANTTPTDCYLDGEPFLTMFPPYDTTKFFFAF